MKPSGRTFFLQRGNSGLEGRNAALQTGDDVAAFLSAGGVGRVERRATQADHGQKAEGDDPEAAIK